MYNNNRFICILLYLLLLLLFVNSQSTRNTPHTSTTTNIIQDEPGGIPFKLQILLIGFQRDGGYGYSLDNKSLQQLLFDSFPTHRPRSIHTSIYSKLFHIFDDQERLYHPKPLLSHYDIDYQVKHLPTSTLLQLESKMSSLLQSTESNVDNENYYLAIEELEVFYENEIRLSSQSNQPVYTIFFVNPSKERLLSSGGLVYQYKLGNHITAPAWIGASRYIVVDLSAGPLKYGSTLHKSTEEKISEGSVSHDSLPRLIEYFQNKEYSGTSLQGASQVEIEAHLSSIIINSLQNVYLSDTNYDFIPLFQKVLIPILIFKDYDPNDQTIKVDIDLNLIEKESKRIFPFSDVKVVMGAHSIHEHKHISMALAKSIKSHSSFELNPITNKFESSLKTFIDSKELLLKLKSEDDILASGLIGEENSKIPTNFNQKDNIQRTKILPIYIFSLINTDENILLDKYHLQVSDQEAIVVLHSPYQFQGIHYQGSQVVDIKPKLINRNIVAGLASCQGLLGPTFRYSPQHDKIKNNYLWSFGHHPFGFFGNTSEISQIFTDIITRNTIITSIQSSTDILNQALQLISDFTNKYLLDSLGFDIDENVPSGGLLIDRFYHSPPSKLPIIKESIKKLHDELDIIYDSTKHSLDLLQTLSPDLIMKKSQKEIISKQLILLNSQVSGFYDYVEAELKQTESQLECCKINSITIGKPSKFTTSKSIFVLSSLALLIILFIMTTNNYKNNQAKKKK
ncbi:transmembrane protein [Cavenderia fasciculata]|uniref:Transmembrane protein n=1 Tax=Cavenderia fasciculata TaxID=261658 RepID=F4Q9S9_CACFS|nr:uncharacterized protein DFA_10285 [Cavenderia fasciculata]EGG15448.1 transmembrane protein [Cavenderia fasciculata]|eukprot:XP_004354190.1 transmembrane protein [Cavenderia fasciculata]